MFSNFALNKVRYGDSIVERSLYSDDNGSVIVKSNFPLGEIVINRFDLLESKLQDGNVIRIHGVLKMKII